MLANIMAGAQNLLTLDAVLALVAGTVGVWLSVLCLASPPLWASPC